MRWSDVDLIENRLAIPDAKTDSGVRVVSIPGTLAEELWQHRRRSAFRGDDERVFCHPELGSEYHIATSTSPRSSGPSSRRASPGRTSSAPATTCA